MIKGRIIKGVGGFYYIKTDQGVVESRARGVFREEKLKPLVGDLVQIKISEEDNTGYIVDLMPRETELIRPAVANVSQAILVMSVRKPSFNSWLLDKFLLMAEYEKLNIVICINKSDLNKDKSNKIKKIYEEAGYDVLVTSTENDLGINLLKERLDNNISVLAGPSGVGKSTLLNTINPNFDLEIGRLSHRTQRGKHTTRHVELLELNKGSYVLDTPGFSSLNLDFLEDEYQVRKYFREIEKHGAQCNFISCLHDQEPKCAVKEMVSKGKINKDRYENYLSILNEVKNIKRY